MLFKLITKLTYLLRIIKYLKYNDNLISISFLPLLNLLGAYENKVASAQPCFEHGVCVASEKLFGTMDNVLTLSL